MDTEKLNIKRAYFRPDIIRVKLDNEISLTLESEEPPAGPGEPGYLGMTQDYFKNDPFNSNHV